ncbi:MAG TPA: DUF5667 domain-containing protein [Candidatus Paceibacterota bacterium]|nr:DUF5667 domain-containing protein [Candidatus Paceibacterota bacterium]
MFNFFNHGKLPCGARKAIAPRKEFIKETRIAFLAVFGAAHPGARARFTAMARSFIAGGAIVALFAGMSVYADTTNVAADSPLYPLKRLGESVQLAVAPASQKAQLQATFAARRAAEISALAAKNPSSTQIAGLARDLNDDVSNSAAAATQANLTDGALDQFCGRLASAVASSSFILQGRPLLRIEALARFRDACPTSAAAAPAMDVATGTAPDAGIGTSASMTATTTATTTPGAGIPAWRVRRIEIRRGAGQ